MSVRFGLICTATVVSMCVATQTSVAQGPTILPICTVQAVNMPPAPPNWQIKGSGSVNNLPAGTMAVTLSIKFEKKAAGAANFAQMFVINQITSPAGGVANFDTGFQSLTPAPAKGDQYRIMVGGTYLVGMQSFVLPNTGSAAITPVP